jgi:pimeloyl-ACP methyl ester carboxylesterase
VSISDHRAVLAALAIASSIACASCAIPAIAIHGDVAHPITSDGWHLTVEHFAPATGATPHPRPVIVCHGVLANRRFFELEGEGSLPVVLSRAGFDVWLVDLRGRPGTSARAGTSVHDYDIDDLVRFDVDALLSYVLAETHAKDVAWVGHSLGGMVAYGRLGALHESRIGALVTVGSPGIFAPASLSVLRGVLAEGALSILPSVPVETLASIDGHIGLSLAPSTLNDTIFKRENMPPETYRLIEDVGVSDGSKRELRQFARSVRAGEFVSADGSVSYSRALDRIVVPSLVIVGRADELADPLVGRAVFERLGSQDKELVVAGRAEGFEVDFGHVDLMVGSPARREVFPRIVAWLARHDGT